MYDDERGIEYTPLKCMNDEDVAKRVNIDGAKECIYAINATQRLNNDIAYSFHDALSQGKLELLVNIDDARENVLPKIKGYQNATTVDEELFYEKPFLETQALISETIDLVYDKNASNGLIRIHEQGNNRKDRYSSASYGNYFADILEKDLTNNTSEYEFGCFVN